MVTTLPRRPPLTTESIVRAARRLIESRGVEACSMRTLVAALGVQAPALYRRIPSKEALLALVLDDVMGDLTPPADGPWQAQLTELMRRLRALFARKPRLAALFASSTPHGPNALRFIAAASAPLQRAGFSQADAGFAITALTTYTIGFTFLSASRSTGAVHRQIQATLRRARGSAASSEAHAVLEATQRGNQSELFEFGLKHLIAGLAADLRVIKPKPSTRRREDAEGRRTLRAFAPSR